MMIVECITITALIAVMIVVFMRSGRPKTALSVMPLLIVPVMHILGVPLSKLLPTFTALSELKAYFLIDILAIIVTCIFIGAFAKYFSTKKTKATYIICCGSYALILPIIFIYNLLG